MWAVEDPSARMEERGWEEGGCGTTTVGFRTYLSCGSTCKYQASPTNKDILRRDVSVLKNGCEGKRG